MNELASSQYVETLLVKAAVAAVLIAAATLVQRRWGQGVGGLVASLPLTSGPLLLYLALDHGVPFARDAAGGAFGELLGFTAYAVGYRWLARYGWRPALLAGIAAFTATATTVTVLAVPHWLTAALVPLAVLLALLCWPDPPSEVDAPRRIGAESTPDSVDGAPGIGAELALRIGVAVATTVLVTESAPILGPVAAGLLAMIPVLSCVLSVGTHRDRGAAAAGAFLRSAVSGLPGSLGFFLMLPPALDRLGEWPGFGAAALTAAVVQLLLPRALTRLAGALRPAATPFRPPGMTAGSPGVDRGGRVAAGATPRWFRVADGHQAQ